MQISPTAAPCGHWKYNERNSSVELISEINTDTVVLKIKEIDKSEMTVGVQKNNIELSGVSFTFTSDDFIYPDSLDLYSKYFNTWRIKPAQVETDEQIRKRVKDNIRFCATYLQDGLDRKKKSISMKEIISPFRLGSNGIGLYNYEEVQGEWINIFYNEEQAQKGYDLINNAMDQVTDIPKTSSWLELDSYLLKQVMEKI